MNVQNLTNFITLYKIHYPNIGAFMNAVDEIADGTSKYDANLQQSINDLGKYYGNNYKNDFIRICEAFNQYKKEKMKKEKMSGGGLFDMFLGKDQSNKSPSKSSPSFKSVMKTLKESPEAQKAKEQAKILGKQVAKQASEQAIQVSATIAQDLINKGMKKIQNIFKLSDEEAKQMSEQSKAVATKVISEGAKEVLKTVEKVEKKEDEDEKKIDTLIDILDKSQKSDEESKLQNDITKILGEKTDWSNIPKDKALKVYTKLDVLKKNKDLESRLTK